MNLFSLLCLLIQASSGQMTGPAWSVRATSPTSIQLEVTLPDTDTLPDEPASAQLVPAPSGELPRVKITELDTITVAMSTAALRMSNPEAAWVTLGRPAVAAGVGVVPLVIERARHGIGTGHAVVCRKMRLELRYNSPIRRAANKNVMSELVQAILDGGAPSFNVDQPGYLIIAPDDFYSNVLPLAAWKERKGFKVWVKKTSETGTTPEQIQTYIRTAYQTWSPTPSYVLLVGAISKIPAFHYSIPQHVSDHPYACVDGDDFLADLFVGRLPAANASELDVIIAKILGYERTPYLDDTLWYHRALMVGTSYEEGGTPAITAIVTKRVIRERMLARGFSQIDTVFYPPTRYGRGPVDSAVNRGVSFINGRGWGNYDGWGYPEFLSSDVSALNNGWKLPVVTSIYCGTGNYARNPCFGEVWLRAGTPTSPRGGVAFWGASWTGTSTRWNNCMDYGIYRAMLDWNVHICGPAMYFGKLEQLENFPLPDDSFDLRAYFQVYNLLGDPSLAMWTRVPGTLNVSHPSSFPVGTSSFDVTVADRSGSPVKDALVCLDKPGEVHAVARTDAAGRAHFAVSTASADTMLVTVTGDNLAPYLGYSVGRTSGVFVGHESHAPASVPPGVASSLAVTLRNFGNSVTALGVTAVLRPLDTFAIVTDSVRSYGDLAPGAGFTAPAFAVAVAPACTSGQVLPFELAVSTTDSAWKSAFTVSVQGPTLDVSRYTVHDVNGFLDPGETVELSATVVNRGAAAAGNVSGILVSLNPSAVSVSDSVGTFGTIAPAESASNDGNRFAVSAASGVGVGRKFTLRLILIADNGIRQVRDFTVLVGRPVPEAPSGPDHYGYYAYDNTDAGYSEQPAYSWLEIDPAYGGTGTKLALANDEVKPVSLPFTFRFYGHDYAQLGVCDNGYLAFDDDPQGEIYNWHIPSACGPDGLIAPFWDDFLPDTLGASGVYLLDDQPNHRLVVEWSRCVHVHGFRPPYPAEQQTFEVMLCDPGYYPTKTGDGPVLVQYLTVQNDDSLWQNCHDYATVGIMSPDHNDGIEYTFAGAYPPAAAEVLPGRAIRFTTNPPDSFTGVRQEGAGTREWRMGISPNPVTSGFATVRFSLPVGAASQPRFVTVGVYDIAGRSVATRMSLLPGGSGVVPLDVRGLPSGVYMVRLTVGGEIALNEKLLVLSGHR